MTATMVDACRHIQWEDPLEVIEYLPAGWREYIGRPGLFAGGRGMAPLVPYAAWEHPDGGRRREPASAAPAARRSVLCLDQSLLVGALPNANYGLSLARALNDWTSERHLAAGDGAHGLVVAPMQVPEQAAAEVRRAGRNPRMVGVLLAGNGLGKPFGHPVYHPVYAAAAELGLPLVVHTGTESPPNTAGHPTAGGYPSTYGEYYSLRAQPIMTHLMSLIVQGVLETYPGLKVLAVGAGLAWLPGWTWRFDSDFKAYAARETPWLRRFPSEQLIRQVRVTTYSFRSAPEPEAFGRFLAAAPWLAGMLCFASGAPRWDADLPETVAAAFPEDWRPGLLHDNAAGLFRWPGGEAG
jgi:predicted TIM-barrel fold metal-dependent hydrolase